MGKAVLFTSAAVLGAIASLASATQARRYADATRAARQMSAGARPFEAAPSNAVARVLVVGDSTGVGLGAGDSRLSLPGLLAERYPDLAVTNRCVGGARVADALAQLQACAQRRERHDLLLILAGGNDVLALTPPRRVAQAAQGVLRTAFAVAPRVVWLGPGDLGIAPALTPPLSWLASRVTRRNAQVIGAIARENGASFVDFSASCFSATFRRSTRRWFAADGLHPSAEAYRFVLDELERCMPLGPLLRGSPGDQAPALPQPCHFLDLRRSAA